MAIDRTAMNREAVIAYLTYELAVDIRAHDRENLSGAHFLPAKPGDTWRLRIGENVLAGVPAEGLIRRLRDEGVVNQLRAGRSVEIMTHGTTYVP